MSATDPRSRLDVDALVHAICQGDDDAVVEMFARRGERERRAVAPALFDAVGDRPYPAGSPVPGAYRDTRAAALFACGTLTEIKRLDVDHTFGIVCNETTYRVLVDRRPGWVTAWAEWALDRNARPSGRASGLWYFVRQLVLAGVCEPLDSDAYILGMLGGTGGGGYRHRQRWHGVHELGIPPDDAALEAWRNTERATLASTIADIVRADPELLEHDVWRIFEVPGRPSCQLGWLDDNGRDWWIYAFLELASAGDIDRGRLLRSSLDGLARDITAYQSRWYIALWHALEPTEAELVDLQESLLHLLAHPVTNVVQFSLRELDTLEQGQALDTERFLDEVGPVILVMPVATAEQALRLIDRVMSRDPTWAGAACLAAANGLLHANAKVAQRAAKLLAASIPPGDAAVVDALDALGLTVDDLPQLGGRGQRAVRAPAPDASDREILAVETQPRVDVAAWHRLLTEYVDRWLPMRWHKRAPMMALVDAFSGPWRYAPDEPGASIVMLNALLEHRFFGRWGSTQFVVCVAEPDPDRIRMLQSAVDVVAARHHGLPENVHVTIEPKRFRSWTGEEARRGSPRGHPVPTLLLVDPFGAGAPLAHVADMLRWDEDMLINFDCALLVRIASQGPPTGAVAEQIEALFGTTDFKGAPSDPDEQQQFLLDLYGRQLWDVLRLRQVRRFERIANGSPTGNFAFFGTRYDYLGPVALQRMKDAMWVIDPEAGSRFSSPYEPIDPPPRGSQMRALAQLVREEFSDQTVKVADLERFTFARTPYRDNAHLRPALKLIQREGDIVEVKGTMRKSPFPSGATVTFRRTQ